jgi:hypothetical protein
MAKGLDFGLGLWRLHTLAVQVERPWEFMAKGLDFGLGLWRLHLLYRSTIAGSSKNNSKNKKHKN